MQLDAIVVPTGRDAAHVRCAVALGADIGVPTVLMCSADSVPRDAAAVAETVPRADCTVVDLRKPVEIEDWPDLLTAEFSEAMMGSHKDLAFKRNLGLVLGRTAGWTAILFLDDDIVDLVPDRVLRATGSLEHHPVVGMRATQFPDNSVVCHARRLAGGRQGVFISGSALAVQVGLADALFPETYNEDWLFLAPHLARREVVAVGTVRQRPFNPFRMRHRAASEEFGDVLGEGLIGSLHRGTLSAALSPAYWRSFLDLRARFLAQTLERCRASNDPRAAAAIPALAAAEQVRARIPPDVLSDYVAAWNTDLRAWRRYLSEIVPTGDLPSALKRLGLPVWTTSHTPAPSPC